MRICGLQKLAMVDFPEKLAATVVNLNTAAEVEEYLKKELAHVL